MTRRSKVTSRPRLESLDGRELPSASPAGLVLTPTLPAVHAPMPVAPTAADLGGVKAASTVFDATYTVSVVTIQNRTTNPVNFSLLWPGTSWKAYTLKPGETRLYYIKGSNLTAQIDFDWSYKPGFQDQRYSLASKNFTAGGFAGLLPSHTTDGRQYYFTTNSTRTGLSFYRV
jgi:hypothetical protein